MPLNRMLASAIVLAGSVIIPHASMAQGTLADYQRAMTLRDKYTGKAYNVAEAPRWIEQTSRFYYRRSVKGGNEWILVDGATQEKKPAFDHARLADAVAKATGRKATAVELPFATFNFIDNGGSIEFDLTGGPGGARGGGGGGRGAAGGPLPWRCSLESYTCREAAPGGRGRGGRGGRGGGGLAGPVRPPFEINGGEPRLSPDKKFEAVIDQAKQL